MVPRASRLIAATFVLVAMAAFAALASARADGHQKLAQAASRLGTCGVERWKVKTLQDRPHLIPAQATTVAHLVSVPRPDSLPGTRLPYERHIFTVTAAVTLVRHEADQDLHVVLTSGSNTMIVEAPDASACAPLATSTRKAQMKSARGAVRLCAKARVIGVAFWDFDHGQTGVAPNAIELHPILSFTCVSPAAGGSQRRPLVASTSR